MSTTATTQPGVIVNVGPLVGGGELFTCTLLVCLTAYVIACKIWD